MTICKIRFACCAFGAWLALGTLRSQDLYSALEPDSSVKETIRSADGGYLSWEYTGSNVEAGGLTVYKYDALLNPIWAKRIAGVEWNRVSSSGTPDGGICLVGRLPYMWMDSTTLAVMRLGGDGTPLWYRTIKLPMWNVETWEYNFHGIEVSGMGEAFIRLRQTSGDLILKLSTTGLPQWLVRVSSANRHLGSILPDQGRGCYFAIEQAAGVSTWETMSLGRLDANGITLWHRSLTWPTGDFTDLRLRNAPDGDVYLGGLQYDNLLSMKFTFDGEPIWFRYFAPDVPFFTCPYTYFRGFASATDGRSAIAAAYNTTSYYSLLLLDEAGHLLSGHKLPETQIAGWTDRVYINDLDAIGNELSITGDLTRTNGSAYDPRALIITAPFDIEAECRFQPMGFEEVQVPINELAIEDMPAAVIVNDFEVLDLAIEVTSLPFWTSESMCTATGIQSAAQTDHTGWLHRNVLQQGETLSWRAMGYGVLKVTDNAGREIALLRVGPSLTSVLNTSGLAPGVYLATFVVNSGAQRNTERFVVH